MTIKNDLLKTERFILTESGHVVDKESKNEDVSWWKNLYCSTDRPEEPLFKIVESTSSIFELLDKGDLVRCFKKGDIPELFIVGSFLYEKGEKIGVSDEFDEKQSLFSDIVTMYKYAQGNFNLFYEGFIVNENTKS